MLFTRGRKNRIEQLCKTIEAQKVQLAVALGVLDALGFALSDFSDLMP